MKSVVHMILILYTVQLHNKMWSPESSTAGMMDGLLLLTARSPSYILHLHLFSISLFSLTCFLYFPAYIKYPLLDRNIFLLFFFNLSFPLFLWLISMYCISYFSSIHFPPHPSPAVTTILSSPFLSLWLSSTRPSFSLPSSSSVDCILYPSFDTHFHPSQYLIISPTPVSILVITTLGLLYCRNQSEPNNILSF